MGSKRELPSLIGVTSRSITGVYIKKLTIQNYRNFGDPAFELPLKQFTLILGENNVGKTNLLNALCLLFGQDISVAQSRMLQLEDLNFQSTAVIGRFTRRSPGFERLLIIFSKSLSHGHSKTVL